METKDKIRTGAEILIIMAFMLSLGVNVNDKDEGYIPYSCAKENVDDMMCYKLSRVNDNGIQRNCYYNRDNSRRYKVCSEGWERIINIDEYEQNCAPLILAYTDKGKYLCKGIGEGQICEPFEDVLSSLG